MDKNSLKQLKQNLRQTVQNQNWSDLIQPDVKVSLFWIIDHIESVGLSFASAFVSAVQYGLLVRSIRKHRVAVDPKSELTSQVIFDSQINHEVYQSGFASCKALLDLPEYITPNYADVRASFLLSKQIYELNNKKAFATSSSNIAERLSDKPATSKAKLSAHDDVEIIHWNLD